MTTASNGAADKDDEQEEQQEEVTGVRGKANRDLNRMAASQDDHDAMDATKLDNAVKMISTELRKDREEKQRIKSALEKVAINEADVKLIMAEFEFSQAEAELALRKNDGDVAKTLEQLISA